MNLEPHKWPTWVLACALTAAMLIAGAGLIFFTAPHFAAELSYTRFRDLAERGEIAKITISANRILGDFRAPIEVAPGKSATTFVTRLPPLDNSELLGMLTAKKVDISVLENDFPVSFVTVFTWVILAGLGYFFLRSLRGGLGIADPGGFVGGHTRRITEGKVPNVRFADVAGQDNAKAEVSELLEFFRNPERYRRLGAEVPHGILLQGPPGTGKTLLAKALAGEASVPYFHISASEFIELFVGVGASRVRDLFKRAKQLAPSIIFIDEIDSVGRVRGAGWGGGHDEREQTLNQILAEMDGFEKREPVVVLAATNRPDVLDPALLRPGRFDRHVTLELPDMNARKAILDVHCRGVPLAHDVDLQKVAAGTPGFSGADLKNLVNEAAMAAARRDRPRVSAAEFEEMRDRILMGSLRTMAIHQDERHRLAVHEAGHAALACYLPNADPLHKVTIIPRGRSLGGTHQLPEIERHTLPEDYLLDRLSVMLAGRASEKLFLGSLSSGADEDIRSATQLARWMVGRWGMSEELGPVDVREGDDHPFLGREMAMPRRFSEATAATADKAIRETLARAEARATEVLKEHREEVSVLVEELEAREVLEHEAVIACLRPQRAGASLLRSGTKAGEATAA